jgi:hypothetical protein
MNRRKFFRNTTYSVAGMIVGGNITKSDSKDRSASSSFNIMKEVMKFRKIDAHEHVGLGGTIESQIDFADRLNIEKLVISRPINEELGKEVTPE